MIYQSYCHVFIDHSVCTLTGILSKFMLFDVGLAIVMVWRKYVTAR